MHETKSVTVFCVNFWSGLLESTGLVRKFLCTPCKRDTSTNCEYSTRSMLLLRSKRHHTWVSSTEIPSLALKNDGLRPKIARV